MLKYYPPSPPPFFSIHYSILPSVYTSSTERISFARVWGICVHVLDWNNKSLPQITVTAGHTDASRLKRVVWGFLSLFCLHTDILYTHSFSSPQYLSHILSDIWHWLLITALVKKRADGQLCHRIRSIFLSSTKDYINKWCGVDVEPEPGTPCMFPPVERHHSSSDLRGSYATSTLGKDEERVIWPWVFAPLTDVPWTECDNET